MHGHIGVPRDIYHVTPGWWVEYHLHVGSGYSGATQRRVATLSWFLTRRLIQSLFTNRLLLYHVRLIPIHSLWIISDTTATHRAIGLHASTTNPLRCV